VKTTGKVERKSDAEVHVATVSAQNQWLPIELTLETGPVGRASATPEGASAPELLDMTWHTAEDPRPRAMQLRRILLPWAKPHELEYLQPATERKVPELAGGDWKRGRELFFSERVACFKCHQVRREGTHVGPDLSNLIHRDYASVMKDILQPSAAINPDAVAYNIQLKDGETITGVPVRESSTEIVFADSTGQITTIGRGQVESMKASSISLMPEGLLQALSGQEVKDLLTFLLTPKAPNQTAASK
jgi:putative heme-binding domain-containing protein